MSDVRNTSLCMDAPSPRKTSTSALIPVVTECPKFSTSAIPSWVEVVGLFSDPVSGSFSNDDFSVSSDEGSVNMCTDPTLKRTTSAPTLFGRTALGLAVLLRRKEKRASPKKQHEEERSTLFGITKFLSKRQKGPAKQATTKALEEDEESAWWRTAAA